jgi:hypothetical protein
MGIGGNDINPVPDFENLYHYPPANEEAKRHLGRLVQITDDAWDYLRVVPPGRIRVLVTPTDADRKRGL